MRVRDLREAEAFATIRDQWNRLVDVDEVVELSEWSLHCQSMIEQQLSMVDRGEWISGPSDLLNVIGRGRRETYHCSVLAWLLEPTAPHGLSSSLLEWVLTLAGRPPAVTDASLLAAVSKCEVWTPACRADIVVRAPGLTLVFEVKVDHGERERQCDDTYLSFKNDPGAVFVFLTKHGRPPVTASGEAREAFYPMKFAAVAEFLSGVRRERVAVINQMPGAPALDTYLQTLGTEFP